LDGLRGIAALIVVVHHCLLVSSLLAAGYQDRSAAEGSRWAWWLTYTPLHLIWAGPEAVIVFFVLSGFVLSLPFIRPRRPSWPSYYARRLARLYPPVWAAAVFSLLTFVLIEHSRDPRLSWWVNAHDLDIRVRWLLRDITLVFGTTWYNSPLWSLRWEVVFSLLFPAYVLAAKVASRKWLLGAAICLVVTAWGSAIGSGYLLFLPTFALGVLMAFNIHGTLGLARRLSRWHWTVLVLAIWMLLTARWMLPDRPVLIVLPTIGAVLLVFLFIGQTFAIQLATTRLAQWLGRISFSLYLIHEPIVVAVAFAFDTRTPWLPLGVALPLSLVLATGFYRLVERPSHRLANALGRRFSSGIRFPSSAHTPRGTLDQPDVH
jgi:peptidoglycan/LPS O-acetylase OafA/YrhL